MEIIGKYVVATKLSLSQTSPSMTFDLRMSSINVFVLPYVLIDKCSHRM